METAITVDDYEHEDVWDHLTLLTIAIRELAGVELAADFVKLLATCDEDEKLVIDFRTEKRDGSSRPYDPMGDVRDWHEAADVKRFSELDSDGQYALLSLRRTLIHEEGEEVYDELTNLLDGVGSIPKLVKELSDMLVHIYGTADLLEVNLPPVFRLVHDNNMTKVDAETGKASRRDDGKILKPDGFVELTEDDIVAVMDAN